MVALRHTIKGYVPRLAGKQGFQWMQWIYTFEKQYQSAPIPPLVSTGTFYLHLGAGEKTIIKKRTICKQPLIIKKLSG
jgi:hypothetical protein